MAQGIRQSSDYASKLFSTLSCKRVFPKDHLEQSFALSHIDKESGKLPRQKRLKLLVKMLEFEAIAGSSGSPEVKDIHVGFA